MNTWTWLWKSVLAWVVLVVATMIATAIVPVNAPSVPHQFAWWLLTNFMVVAAITFAAVRSDWRGLRLGFAAAVLPLFVSLTDMLEGAIFLGHLGIDWKRLAVESVLSYALSAPVWGMIFSIGRERLPRVFIRSLADRSVREFGSMRFQRSPICFSTILPERWFSRLSAISTQARRCPLHARS